MSIQKLQLAKIGTKRINYDICIRKVKQQFIINMPANLSFEDCKKAIELNANEIAACRKEFEYYDNDSNTEYEYIGLGQNIGDESDDEYWFFKKVS